VFAIIGTLIVLASVIGGFLMGGSSLLLLDMIRPKKQAANVP